MIGIKNIPLERRRELYQEIPRNALLFSEKDLRHFILNSRIDPRLAEVTTEHIRDYWWKYDPCLLNSLLRKSCWPQSVLPMLFQIEAFCQADESTRQMFLEWSKKVRSSIPKAAPQLYFIDGLKPRSKTQDRDVLESLAEFRRAGYFSREVLFNKGLPKKIKKREDHDLPKSVTEKLRVFDLLGENIKNKKIKTISLELKIDRDTAAKLKAKRIRYFSLERLIDFCERLSL